MPKVPMLPAIIKKIQRSVAVVSTRSGTTYRHIAENATIIIAGVEIIPAFTAVSPKTKAPTMDMARPTYFGMRMEASFKTSSTKSVKNISMLGESGRPETELEIFKSSLKGMSCSLNSWAATYIPGSNIPTTTATARSTRRIVAR